MGQIDLIRESKPQKKKNHSVNWWQKVQNALCVTFLIYASNVSSQTIEAEHRKIFFQNIERGLIADLSAALQLHPSLISAKDDQGNSGLMIASQMGQLEVVDVLLKNGASATETARDGTTALHKAMIKGSAKQIKLLIDAGADPVARNDDLESPLSYGVFANNVDAVSYLSKSTKDFKREINKCFCLSQSVDGNNKEMLILLLKSGGNPNQKKLDGSTPLINAAYDREDLLETLLAAGASKKLKNATGHTALDVARIANNQKAIQILSRP